MEKHIWKIDLVLIVVTVFVLIFLVGYSRPLIIAPLDDFETTNNAVLFSIDKAEKVLIDDNIEFTSPEVIEVKEGLKVNLEPGAYYWKAVGVLDSEIRTLTVKSKISLILREIGEGEFGVVNSGNIGLNLEVYNGTSLVETRKIRAGSEERVSGDKFIGGAE